MKKFSKNDIAICPENTAAISVGSNPIHLTDFYLNKNDLQIKGHSVMMGYLNHLDYSVALNTENFSNELNIYPTVTNSYIFLESNEPVEGIIFDITGKEILRKTIHYNLNIKNFENGVYLMKVLYKSNFVTKKIIKI